MGLGSCIDLFVSVKGDGHLYQLMIYGSAIHCHTVTVTRAKLFSVLWECLLHYYYGLAITIGCHHSISLDN